MKRKQKFHPVVVLVDDPSAGYTQVDCEDVDQGLTVVEEELARRPIRTLVSLLVTTDGTLYPAANWLVTKDGPRRARRSRRGPGERWQYRAMPNSGAKMALWRVEWFDGKETFGTAVAATTEAAAAKKGLANLRQNFPRKAKQMGMSGIAVKCVSANCL